MTRLILAEKPSVARDLARALGVPATGGAGGCFRGGAWVITWCLGHLVELEEPASYEAAWRRWTLSVLPMIPARFALRPIKSDRGGARQWRVVRELLRDRSFSGVVNACDAGREGELIFRYCYELAGSRLPIERLWISSLTTQAIGEGLARLGAGRDFEPLAAAARCRAEADWLVGMNATRAVTLWRRGAGDGPLLSIGRVQTPTLAILVRRERAIERFVPQDYWEVRGELSAPGGRFLATWRLGTARRLGTAALADELVRRSTAAAQRGEGPVVESLEERTQREPPPLLFDLTALQRTANRRFGLSAKRTLEVAQALYERHKLITYPRTDSRYLTRDLLGELPRLLSAVAAEPTYAPFVAALPSPPPAPRRVFSDGRVQDHHAIIPTALPLDQGRTAGLSREERLLLDLIVRRFLGAFYPDAVFQRTRVVVRVGEGPPAPPAGDGGAEVILPSVPPPPDRYEARGRVRVEAGWQAVAGIGEGPRPGRPAAAASAQRPEDEEAQDEAQALPLLQRGQRLDGRFFHEALRTRPPPRYSEATLLSAMETAGKELDDEELRARMRDVALGTPATRAAIIETLLDRGYAVREGRTLQPTALGVDLIERLPVASLGSPELTGEWEARLAQIARGEGAREAFMADIARYVRELIQAVHGAPVPAPVPGAPARPTSRSGRGPSGRGGTGRRGRSAPSGAAGAPRPRRAAAAAARAAGAQSMTGDEAPARRPRMRRAAGAAAGTQSTAGDEASARRPRTRKAATAAAGTQSMAGDEAPARRPRTRRAASAAATQSLTGDEAPARRPRTRPAAATIAQPAGTVPRSRASLRPPAAPARGDGPVGAPLSPPVACPRCQSGQLLVGRRGWGCSRYREGCPLVIPFEVFGCRLSEGDLRQIVQSGASAALQFRTGAGPPLRGRLRLAAAGSPAGFVYLDPL